MERVKVIIVDDELPIRESLKMFPWEKYGYYLVGEAKNGFEALELCINVMPDIVLTDIVMPNMNGLDFIRNLKTINPLAQIILITMYDEFEYAVEALRLGAKEYLLKGVYTEQDLVDALNRAKNDLNLVKHINNKKYNLDYSSKDNDNNKKTSNVNILEITDDFRFEIKKAIDYINQNLDKNISIKCIAEQVGYSPNYFSYLFKKVTGYSVKDYIFNARMKKAIYLLKFSNMKIYEIAEKVGIPNYRYFTAIFSKHFGQCPSYFRGE